MRKRESGGESGTLIREVSEPDQMGSLHTDDGRHLDQRGKRQELHRVQAVANST